MDIFKFSFYKTMYVNEREVNKVKIPQVGFFSFTLPVIVSAERVQAARGVQVRVVLVVQRYGESIELMLDIRHKIKPALNGVAYLLRLRWS
jgi:hypothetical protein